jgi:hypothetical protein
MRIAKHVNDSQLQTLLYGDEDSSASTDIARHVESCELCQQRLTQMASMASTELEVSQLLSGFVDTKDGDNRSSLWGSEKAGQVSAGINVELGPPSKSDR